ncbi:MAG: cytosine permease [Firmicutes bacterium]|nr:cytosine permease [Bacillota bacterium]
MSEEMKKDLATENINTDAGYTDRAVPLDQRRTWPSMTFAWFGAAMFVGLYYSGVELGSSMGTLNTALLAILCGCVFLAGFVTLNGIMGYKTGCTAALIGRYSYGSRGAAIPGFHVTDTGWNIMSTAQIAVILAAIFPVIDMRVFCVLCSVLFLTNSFIGFKAMVTLNKFAMPILLLTGLYGLFRLHVITDGGLMAVFGMQQEQTIALGAGITIVVGTWVSGSSRAADYFRFAKSTKDTVIAACVGFFAGLIICLVIAAFWGAGIGAGEIVPTLTTLGGGMMFFGFIMFTLQTWTTNEHNGFVTSNAIPACTKAVWGRERIKRSTTVAIMIILCIIFCGFGVEKIFTPFLSVLGTFLPAIGAISIADFYIMSRTNYHWTGHKHYYNFDVNDPEVEHHKFNPSTIPGILAGVLVGFLLDWGIAAVNSMVTSIVVYCICCILLSGVRKKEAAKNKVVEGRK